MILSTEESGTLEDIKYTGEMDEDILEITFFKNQEIRFENLYFQQIVLARLL